MSSSSSSSPLLPSDSKERKALFLSDIPKSDEGRNAFFLDTLKKSKEQFRHVTEGEMSVLRKANKFYDNEVPLGIYGVLGFSCGTMKEKRVCLACGAILNMHCAFAILCLKDAYGLQPCLNCTAICRNLVHEMHVILCNHPAHDDDDSEEEEEDEDGPEIGPGMQIKHDNNRTGYDPNADYSNAKFSSPCPSSSSSSSSSYTPPPVPRTDSKSFSSMPSPPPRAPQKRKAEEAPKAEVVEKKRKTVVAVPDGKNEKVAAVAIESKKSAPVPQLPPSKKSLPRKPVHDLPPVPNQSTGAVAVMPRPLPPAPKKQAPTVRELPVPQPITSVKKTEPVAVIKPQPACIDLTTDEPDNRVAATAAAAVSAMAAFAAAAVATTKPRRRIAPVAVGDY